MKLKLWEVYLWCLDNVYKIAIAGARGPCFLGPISHGVRPIQVQYSVIASVSKHIMLRIIGKPFQH